MNLKLLIVLTAVCLTACAPRIVRDDSPASDLDAYKANVVRQGTMTLLPNGKTYCAEDAATEDAQDACMGNLEDALYRSDQKVARLVDLAYKFVERLRLARNPCSWWERVRGVDRCKAVE